MSAAKSIGAALVLLTAISGSAGAETPPKAPETKPAPDTKVVTTEPIHALVLPMKAPTCSIRRPSSAWVLPWRVGR